MAGQGFRASYDTPELKAFQGFPWHMAGIREVDKGRQVQASGHVRISGSKYTVLSCACKNSHCKRDAFVKQKMISDCL